ncbi:MAG TPA: hypothetical protein VJB99_00955 [Patescibacteria group bacterium]|nr:hypothetical protein [Patescibacteria group bacterium]
MGVSSWIGTRLWQGRDTVSSFAPDGTMVLLRFAPTQNLWSDILRDFGEIRLTRNKPLTLKNLSPFLGKELAIFLLSDGTVATVVRSNQKPFPEKELKIYGVVVQRVKKNIYLLSESPLTLPVHPQKVPLNLSALLPETVGTLSIHLPEKLVRGRIQKKSAGYEAVLSGFSEETSSSNFLQALPPLTNAAVSFSPGPTPFFPFFSALKPFIPAENTAFSSFQKALEYSGGAVYLFQEEPLSSLFLIQERLEPSFAAALLQTMAVSFSPIHRPLFLPDGSAAEELITDSSFQPIEQTEKEEEITLRLPSEKGPAILLTAASTIFGTPQTLSIFQDKTKKMHSCLSKPSVFLKPEAFRNFLSSPEKILRKSLWFEGFEHFSSLETENIGKKRKIFFCK